MSRKFTLILICLFSSSLFTQAQVEVSGQVKDSQTKENLEFCSIAVLDSKDSLIKGSVTDDKGFFKISLARSNYRFVFRFIGYKPDTTSLTAVPENKFLGVIKLKPDDKFLNEVTISTSSRESLIDRDIQIVTDKMRAGASNTSEVLEKLNGVKLDRFNNSIKVDNSDNVIILVDGMQKDQEYIKNLSPERLKKIEVIRDPGGRYGLEGYSAVINIILKQDYQGTEFYITEMSLTDPDAVKSDYIFAQNKASTTLNYVYNKVNVYAKYSNNYDNFNLQSSGKKEYDNGLIIEKGPLSDQDMNTRVKKLTNGYTIGTDYYINPKHTVSFEGNLNTEPLAKNTTIATSQLNYMVNGNSIGNLSIETKSRSQNTNSYGALFYEGKLDENNKLNSNLTISNYSSNYINDYKENSLLKRKEQGKDNKNSTEFYFEYLHTFNAKTNIQAGYGNSFKKLNSNYALNDLISQFEYTDFRHKLYSYFSWQQSKKVGIKFGGATETSLLDANGQQNSYLIFQPYADIKYKPLEYLDFKAKYRSASNYPNISQTNPFTNIIDQQSVKTGNPYLRPEVTHKASLQTTIYDGLVRIEPYYHFSSNYISEIGLLRSDSIFEYSYSNIGTYRNYGIEAGFTIPFSQSISLQTDFNFFRSSITYANKINNIKDWTMSSQLVYVHAKSGTVGVLKYQKNIFKDITAQGYKQSDNDYWIMLIQKPFFKQKLNIMLLYFIPVNLGVNYNQGGYIQTETYRESNFGDISFLKNIVMLEIKYRFNRGKSVKKTEKNIEQKNEKNTDGVL
ncbi:MAG: outer membrane beta-barrel protein [Bacteroidota bacterium]